MYQANMLEDSFMHRNLAYLLAMALGCGLAGGCQESRSAGSLDEPATSSGLRALGVSSTPRRRRWKTPVAATTPAAARAAAAAVEPARSTAVVTAAAVDMDTACADVRKPNAPVNVLFK